MSGHTKGPWRARGYRTGKNGGNAQPGSIWIDCAATSKSGKVMLAGTIAEVYANGTGSNNPAVQDANARLIAAAPDLLSALVAAREHISLFCAVTDDISAAVFEACDAAIAKARGETP